MIDISVIIPFRGDNSLLKKLLWSIPESSRIEVIVADNNNVKYKPSDFFDCRPIILIPVDPSKGAGGARNLALTQAKGKWIIFADSDDYFVEGAFDLLLANVNHSSDLIYFKSEGMIINSGLHADRADYYSSIIDQYSKDGRNEDELRYCIGVPWGKMIKRTLIEKYNILFDEIVAGNDAYFSLLCGYYAETVSTIQNILYIVTVSEGTLTQRKDYAVVSARLYSCLHCNQFLRAKDLGGFQYSIMYYFLQSCKFGIRQLIDSVNLIIRFRQNPFVGCRRWISSAKNIFVK